MCNSPRQIASVITALVLFSGGAWAATTVIDGNVLDQKGQPLKGADIRIERSGGSTWKQAVKTNDKGYYSCGGLEAGVIYRVSLIVDNKVRASINNVKTRISPAVHMNFDMNTDKMAGSATAASPKKKTHKVWMEAETGSNLGGRWVEVDEQGLEPGTSNVKKVSGDSIRSMQIGNR